MALIWARKATLGARPISVTPIFGAVSLSWCIVADSISISMTRWAAEGAVPGIVKSVNAGTVSLNVAITGIVVLEWVPS